MRALLPLLLARLWWRGRAEPGYRAAMAERLGCFPGRPREAAGWVWVHAVSLGETRAAAPLIDALRQRLPGLRLLLTHGTATGREAGLALLREGDRQAWLPLDTPGATRRFLAHFQPRLGLLMETEVWPNLQHAAAQAGVPMLLVNARLSDKSLRRGQRLAALMRPAAESLTLALAQTQADAGRLRQAGVPQVQVCGNLKYDMLPPPALIERGRAWRAASGAPVLLLASTREGEEALLLAAWLAHQGPGRPAARLLIVPRHPQRFDEVQALIERAGLCVQRRSAWGEGQPAPADAPVVWLGDSMGEMPAYYAAADVALLGGSFEPLGGQNLIEAAACGCPLLMGPSTFNFAQAAEEALAAGAARRVADAPAAVAAALALLAKPQERQAMVAAAVQFSARHRGAATRMAELVVAVAQRGGGAAGQTSPGA